MMPSNDAIMTLNGRFAILQFLYMSNEGEYHGYYGSYYQSILEWFLYL